jgi:prophage tail gpP-like protein
MSGLIGANGPISQTPDEIAIVIGGTRITGWESAAITRSVEQFPSSFVLTAADQFADDATRATISPKGAGEKCQIFIGSDLVVTGYVDKYSTNIGPGHHDITITGRGLCQDLVDCSADIADAPGLQGGTISAGNLRDLATILCKPFGVDLGKPIPPYTIHLGDTVYNILEEFARYCGYLLYEDELGTLVLDRVGTQPMASGFTMPGNIEGASSTLSINQRFSKYTVVWNSIAQYNEINPLSNQRFSVTDPTMPRYRPRIWPSLQYMPGEDFAQLSANWDLARRIGRSQAINLTCDSWRDSAGMLWQLNRLAPINAPALKIVNAQWIIGNVVFRKDQSGTHADVTLMPPDAFNPQPAPLYLWDREIMHSTQGQDGASLPPQDGVS